MVSESEPTNAEAYLDRMTASAAKMTVWVFPITGEMKFAALETLEGDILHADGSWENDAEERQVAVVFGPQHGPVTAMQVEDCLRIAYQRGLP